MSQWRVNPYRLWQLVRKEFRQTLRDPRSGRLLFTAPVLQVLIFGYVVNTDVRNAKTFVVDHDRSSESRQLVSALTASGYFHVVGQGDRPAELIAALDRGDIVLGLEIPHGFAEDIGAMRPAVVQVLVDGSSANTANVALGYASQIIARFGLERGAAVAARAAPARRVAGVDFRARAWYNPNLESRVYNVPGVVGQLMMLMCLLLTALGIVREREIGTLEQLMVSPLTPTELILGKTLPVIVVGFADLLLIITTGLVLFAIPFRGSFLLLAVAGLCYIFCGLGIGLLISTVSNTQQEAFMTMFFFLLPITMLSGFFFPVANMPVGFQYLTLLDPMRHFLEVVRGVFLRGAGWGVLYPQIVALFAMGVVVLWFATTRLRKTTV